MRNYVIAAAVFSAAAIATPAYAAGDTATATGQAAAEIVSPIAISHDSATLHFGTLVPGTAPSTVTVNTDNSVIIVGDANHVPGVTPTADSFTVTGEAGRIFNILTFPGEVLNAQNDKMAFTTRAAVSDTLQAGGNKLLVGGTLDVAVAQPSGTYTGGYGVTVSYN